MFPMNFNISFCHKHISGRKQNDFLSGEITYIKLIAPFYGLFLVSFEICRENQFAGAIVFSPVQFV